MSDDRVIDITRPRERRSASVPRGTVHRAERLSVRVPLALKERVRSTVTELQALGTSESELVEMLVDEGLRATPDQLDARLRRWRGRRPLGGPS